jgi:hypothetical protein
MPTSARPGTSDITAWRLAERRALRMREPNRVIAAAVSLSSAVRSCPNAFTTRTPLVVSSTMFATSAARCCASQLEG